MGDRKQLGILVELNDCVLLVVRSTLDHLVPSRSIRDDQLKLLCLTLDLPFHFADIKIESNFDLKSCLQVVAQLNLDGRRSRLLIAGSNLEDVVTFETLEALAHGFEVFLLADLIEVLNPSIAPLHWDRLIQAGAVPTSISQILAEWSIASSDETAGIKIRTCQDIFRTIQS